MIFYDNTIKISRLKISSGNKRNYVATATADASIQPLGKQGGEISEGVFGHTFVGYVETDTPANKGDQVVDKNGIVYSITDVIMRDYGAFPHKEMILERES